jgi:hypothetical protein
MNPTIKHKYSLLESLASTRPRFLLATESMQDHKQYRDNMSWEFRDSSHGDGLMEGLDSGDDGSDSGLCQWRHLGYRGSGPSTPEVKPLLPACFLLASQWLQRSSSCSSRGGRRRRIPSPRLRAQTPLYRRGSGYRLGGRLLGCRVPAAASSA